MKFIYLILLILSFIFNNQSIAQIDEVTAEEKVKSASCLDGLTIEQVLKNKFHSRSQRDLGWQVFKEQDQYDVERAFLMSKSMQLRFRWHVNAEGIISPDGGRAESLCTKGE